MVSLAQAPLENVVEARAQIICLAIRFACPRASNEEFDVIQRDIDLHADLLCLGRAPHNTQSVIEFYRLIAQATQNPLVLMMVYALAEAYRAMDARERVPAPNKDVMVVRQRVFALMRNRNAQAAPMPWRSTCEG